MVLRSLIFHDDAPPCADRYARGSQFAIESNGQAMAVGELQSRLSGSDWGLIESARVVKLKSGPAPYAIEYALAKQQRVMSPPAEKPDRAIFGSRFRNKWYPATRDK